MMQVKSPPLWAKLLASALLAFHVAAMIVAPWSASPSSNLSQFVAEGFRPYLQAAYMNHGYHFFSPEPGPSHLVRYELTMPDGIVQKGTFPDKEVNRPRLYYHRHFMLTEFLVQFPPDEKSAAQWERQPDWRFQQLSKGQQVLATGYADHLLHKYGAKSVKLYLIRHVFPTPMDVERGMKLDDASLYQEKLLGVFSRKQA